MKLFPFLFFFLFFTQLNESLWRVSIINCCLYLSFARLNESIPLGLWLYLFTWERHLSLTELITGKWWRPVLLSLDSAFHLLDTLWETRLNSKPNHRWHNKRYLDRTPINNKPYKYRNCDNLHFLMPSRTEKLQF